MFMVSVNHKYKNAGGDQLESVIDEEFVYRERISVIGNIYSNPELVK